MSSLKGKPSGRRKYTQEEKDRFFAVLDRVGRVRVAAEELGLNAMTCCQWTRTAGVRVGQRKSVAGPSETAPDATRPETPRHLVESVTPNRRYS